MQWRNGPGDEQARPNVALDLGQHSFWVLGSQGSQVGYHGLNLFFDGHAAPDISVFGLDLANQRDPHQFWANAATQTPGPEGLVPAAGTLAYQTPLYRVTLTDFFFAPPDVYGVDWVGALSINPDGLNDYVGQFTLNVALVPEPAIWGGLSSLGLLALACWRSRSRLT